MVANMTLSRGPQRKRSGVVAIAIITLRDRTDRLARDYDSSDPSPLSLIICVITVGERRQFHKRVYQCSSFVLQKLLLCAHYTGASALHCFKRSRHSATICDDAKRTVVSYF